MDAVWAITFITVGSLLLLNNLNLLPRTIWSELWKFWPVILILLGIQAIFGRSKLGEFFVFIIGLALVGGILYLLWHDPTWFSVLRPRRNLYLF
jgi:hypothetical protein